jgi:hypothetical protein
MIVAIPAGKVLSVNRIVYRRRIMPLDSGTSRDGSIVPRQGLTRWRYGSQTAPHTIMAAVTGTARKRSTSR